jgi:hypothetical protein
VRFSGRPIWLEETAAPSKTTPSLKRVFQCHRAWPTPSHPSRQKISIYASRNKARLLSPKRLLRSYDGNCWCSMRDQDFHPSLSSIACNRSISFYRDKLGFEVMFQEPPAPEQDPFFAIVRRDGAMIFLERQRFPKSACPAEEQGRESAGLPGCREMGEHCTWSFFREVFRLAVSSILTI